MKDKDEYYINPRLKHFLQKNIKDSLVKKDKDYVMIVDGYEGAGKSTFGKQVGKFVDPNLHLDRVCMTVDEFKSSIINAKKGQCVIYDEAVTGMSSGDSISRIGKLLKSMMMQMRQKNLFVIIILPSIFELNKYAVLSRSRSFFHVYESKGKRGYFVGYNRKDTRLLYLKGKKTHSYCMRSYFSGRFYGKPVLDDDAYRKKKEEALFKMDINDNSEGRISRERKINLVNWYYEWKEKTKGTQEEFIQYIKQAGIELKRNTLSEYATTVREKGLIVACRVSQV